MLKALLGALVAPAADAPTERTRSRGQGLE
jgi:hypothetical protein